MREGEGVEEPESLKQFASIQMIYTTWEWANRLQKVRIDLHESLASPISVTKYLTRSNLQGGFVSACG